LVSGWKLERFRHHPDYLRSEAVDLQRLCENIGGATKPVHPQLVTQHDDAVPAKPFLGIEHTAENRRNSHQRAEICGDKGARHRLRLTCSSDSHARESTVAVIFGDIFKSSILGLH